MRYLPGIKYVADWVTLRRARKSLTSKYELLFGSFHNIMASIMLALRDGAERLPNDSNFYSMRDHDSYGSVPKSAHAFFYERIR